MLEDRRNKTLEQMVDQNIVVHIEDKISKTVISLQTRQPVQSGMARLTDPLTNLTHILYCRCCLCVCFVCIAFLTCVFIDSQFGIVFWDLGDPWVVLGGSGVRCVAGQTPLRWNCRPHCLHVGPCGRR
jgi:hypothetical protein